MLVSLWRQVAWYLAARVELELTGGATITDVEGGPLDNDPSRRREPSCEGRACTNVESEMLKVH